MRKRFGGGGSPRFWLFRPALPVGLAVRGLRPAPAEPLITFCRVRRLGKVRKRSFLSRSSHGSAFYIVACRSASAR